MLFRWMKFTRKTENLIINILSDKKLYFQLSKILIFVRNWWETCVFFTRNKKRLYFHLIKFLTQSFCVSFHQFSRRRKMIILIKKTFDVGRLWNLLTNLFHFFMIRRLLLNIKKVLLWWFEVINIKIVFKKQTYFHPEELN